ncbi:ABC transporter permease [Collinsella sp. An2]|uniref:FtsX-like permease family protein n=1 Tax=Collinsella sp. An2 TaxID=1965585 RepID=UPI000B3796B6|nr:ABC transporter permease [Collinsella sp. An2]OUP07307.1 ABC transporter permease [Collinsella sp. An2]
MLCKIALGNVRRAGKDYLVYLLTLTLAVTVFYAFNTISLQVDIAGVTQENAGMGETLGSIISGLTVFLAVVMGFLMVYANNFIMKRRKKEFGLYQVLGMSRGQVARIMALETLFVSLAALVLGVVLGLALSQLMVFFTASLFKTQIANFHFFFSVGAFMTTVGCLVAIFLVTLIFNLRVVARARIIDLMSASRKNETIKTRNPWVSAAIFIVGLAAIIVAYVRLLNDGLPYDGSPQAMQAFLITTIIVVVGTILFFFGLSGFLLKALQGARGIYWRGLNMVTLRQLAAKVNTVSFSMAMIAMILFLAITSVTAGMSLASVMNENVDRGTPVDFTRCLVYFSPQTVDEMNASGDAPEDPSPTHYAVATEPVDLMKASEADTFMSGEREGQPFDLQSIVGDYVEVNAYDSTPLGTDAPVVSLQGLCDAVNMPLPKGVSDAGVETLGLMVMRASDYNAYRAFRGMDALDVGEDGYTLLSDMGDTVNRVYNAVLGQGIGLTIGGRSLHPVQDRVDVEASVFINSSMGMNSGTIVLPDDVVDSLNLPLYYGYLLCNYADGVSVQDGDDYVSEPRSYGEITNSQGDVVAGWGVEATRTTTYQSVDSMNGLISYLAIYIGFVLVVACAAILTIQQLSGVADAGPNYRILSELGTSTREISHSVLVQQAIFFVFPLVMGIAHSCVALSVIIELVALFGGMSIGGTVGLTAAIFVVAYGGYFLVTYLMSKGIIRDAVRVRHGE